MGLAEIILLLAVVAVIGAAGATFAVRYSRSNRVVPGTDSPAPLSWQGSHDPEARLHRRLQESIASLRVASANDPGRASMVAGVEREAIEIDHQLVATSMLNRVHRDEAMADLEIAVERIEAISAEVIDLRTQASDDSVAKQIEELAVRLESMNHARAEVERADRRGRRQTG